MYHYIVHCEFRGKRRNTVEVPVDASNPMLACEVGERIAASEFGGVLNEWFAWKVEPDNE
jgi:hypothetical protein